jgi:Zn-dependent protease
MSDHPAWLPPVVPPPPAPEPPRTTAEDAFGPRRRSRLKRAGGPVAAALAILAKLGAKLKALLILLPKLKLLSTSGSMLVSVAAYSLIWGWRFAAGFVLLLLVHELGHVIQLRREGVPASAPFFIPFLGAVVAMRSMPRDAAMEARVGLAGPVLGSLGAAAVAVVAALTGSDLLRALAFTGFFLNLFNLVPVTPLDGGRAMAAMAPWMWWVGLAVIVGVAVAFPNPIILIIAVFAGVDLYRRWHARRHGAEAARAYYSVPAAQRIAVAAVYLVLIVGLVVGMDATHLARTFHDV